MDSNLQISNHKLASEWHPTKNGSLTPGNVTLYSRRKVWWICSKGHAWAATVCHRSAGRGCPYCAGQRVCEDNCLEKLNPVLASEWHPTKNGSLTPGNVTLHSSKKVWWKCRGHEWQSIVANRSIGTGCPYCAGQRVCEDNCLETLNPVLVKE